MSDAFANRRAAGNAARGLVRIDIVVMAAAAAMVVMIVMIVVVMMTARANFLSFHRGILHFQFVSHYSSSSFSGIPEPAPAGLVWARCCRGS